MEKVVKDVFVVLNPKGLHTRPSTELVKCVANFDAQVQLIYQDYVVNAKSILGILMLAAGFGAKIVVQATGKEAKLAVAAVVHLAKNRFNIRY